MYRLINLKLMVMMAWNTPILKLENHLRENVVYVIGNAAQYAF